VQVFHPPQNFEHQPFWNGAAKALETKLWCQGHLQWYDLLAEFHADLSIGSEVDGGNRHTNRMVISLAYIFPVC
jgi:hypothetical protein